MSRVPKDINKLAKFIVDRTTKKKPIKKDPRKNKKQAPQEPD